MIFSLELRSALSNRQTYRPRRRLSTGRASALEHSAADGFNHLPIDKPVNLEWYGRLEPLSVLQKRFQWLSANETLRPDFLFDS